MIRERIKRSSTKFAEERDIKYTEYKTAIIFQRIENNFMQESWNEIIENKEYFKRTKKKHPKVPGAFEMQSSNSSDALLMNIFCYPKINEWKSIKNLFNMEKIEPKFGIKVGVKKQGNIFDQTEIDMMIDQTYFEAKLTETSFTEIDLNSLRKYVNIEEVFLIDKLPIA